MIRLKYIWLFLLLALSALGQSQELTAKAHALYQSKDYEGARVMIDSAITTSEQTNSQTWQLRGLIYRKLETQETPQYRTVAIESFIKARETDKDGIYKDKINEYLVNTIVRYYNDAVTYLNAGMYVESEKAYVQFKTLTNQLVDPNKSFNNEDIEYYNALGSGYSKMLSQLSGKDYEIAFTLGLNALSKVLAIDSMNYLANLNSAVMYYNRGADLIVNQDPENTDIEALMQNIADAEKLFLNALPLMKRAYSINPDNVEVLEGLSGIYYSLNDLDNHTIYQTKLDKINLPKLLEAYEKNPNDKEVVKQLVRIYSSTLKDDAQYQKFKAILDQLGG